MAEISQTGQIVQQNPILTLTLNPALDMATGVPRIVAGEKLRCSQPKLDPGGGGLNVSRAVARLQGESLALVALGGLTGQHLADLIRADGVTFLAIKGPGETRQSLTVTEGESGLQYRFMLPGPVWNEEDQGLVFTLLRAAARPGGIGVISGSQPPGVPVDFARKLAASMRDMQVVMDTSGPALTEAVTRPVPGLTVLRMDSEEAEALAGIPLKTREESAGFAAGLVARGVAKQVIVARGADGSVLAEAGRRLFCPAPKVPVVSKVGAGDSFVAGYVLALARGQATEAALAQGVAAAAAAVMTEATELCRVEDVARLVADCPVSEL